MTVEQAIEAFNSHAEHCRHAVGEAERHAGSCDTADRRYRELVDAAQRAGMTV